MVFRIVFALLAAVLVGTPDVVFAQLLDEAADPVESASIQIGPVGLTPTIAVSNVGLDSNVFNQVTDPKRDFTFTLTPGVNAWLISGRSLFMVTANTNVVYFHTYSSERSLDTTVSGRYERRQSRIRPWVEMSYGNSRERVGYEIDLRSRRLAKGVGLGVQARLWPKLRLGVAAERRWTAFDADDVFLGQNLSRSLNRSTDTGSLELRYEATVYTTIVARTEVIQDRFEFEQNRDADSVRLLGGLDLAERALVRGSARVGYRRFMSQTGAVPNFSGVVTSVRTAMTPAGRVRVELSGERDIIFSFESVYPYYVLTDGQLTVTPRLTEHWDIQGRVGGRRLAYRRMDALLAERLDRQVSLGAGIGYTLGRSTRVGFNIDHLRRASPIQSRDYEGYRVGSSVSYGL